MNVKMILFAFLLGTLLDRGSGGGNATGEKPTPHLFSLAVTPVSRTISRGNARQFTATGTYTDNTSHDLTSNHHKRIARNGLGEHYGVLS